MKKIILLLMLLVASISNGFSQTSLQGMYSKIDVNGLILGEQYTDAQMRAALGEPTDFLRDVSELGELRRYRYGPAERYEYFIHNVEFDGFKEFAIKSPKFRLFRGRLKTGDNISRVTELKLGKLVIKGRGRYELSVGAYDVPITISTNTSGVITSFWINLPV